MAHKHHHRSLHDRRDVYSDLSRFVDMEFINNDRSKPPPPPPPPPSPPGNDESDGQRAAKDADMRTVVETIYKTLDPTFSGPIAGYVTLSEDTHPPPSPAPGPASSDRKLARIESKSLDTTAPSLPTSESPSVAQITSSFFESAAVSSPTTEVAASASSTTSADESSSSSFLSSSSSSSSFSSISSSTSSSISSPTSSARAAADLSRGGKGGHDSGNGGGGGSGPGVKVGIALGVMGGIVALGLMAFFLLKRRRKQAEKGYKLQDEKPRKGFGAISNPFESSSARDNPGAPRISLRPVTQFLPNWNGLEKRTSKGPMTAKAAAEPNQGDPWDRTMVNPFDNVPSTIAEEQSVRSFSTSTGSINGSNPFAGGRTVGPPSTRSPPPGSMALSTSPTGTDYSLSSVSSEAAAAGAAAGLPPVSAVHRVQLDFKPTLDDEMELRIGELIRLLHEYDDGWCLVSRLDRSQQGVVPRTCLSTRPVKPRQPQGAPRPGPPVNPTGPGRGPNQVGGPGPGPGPTRPGPPGGGFGRPPSPPRPPTTQSFRSGPVGGNNGHQGQQPMNRPGWPGSMKPRYRVSPPGPPPQYRPMGPISRKPMPG
ncbi:hypothetical protein XA68_10121 [Ophiocordyceps unilateralis]|uniref:SH3 domain-containing protein n=1 Tax=Ophiocordyceps unilateralis TaxID=268505 RepID=A0A2A9P2W1_OPHUN|nr:hypothetical protein XA68_10121 [Ophiocordyceps unilateralis]